MNKYFCTETDEQVNFGDELHLSFFKETKNGKVTVEKDVIFTEDTMDWMIEMGFIKEREEEDEEVNTPKDDLIDFDEDEEEKWEVIEDFLEDFENLEKRVDKLEDLTIGVLKEMARIVKILIDKEREKEGKKPAQPKKK